jgi:hypothetical protein
MVLKLLGGEQMKTRVLAAAAALVAVAGLASADSITTVFSTNNSGSAGGGVYFNITTGANPITITGFDVNTTAAAGLLVPFRAWIEPGTFVGNQANAAFWGTEDTFGSGTSAGSNGATGITLNNNVLLAANTQYAVALSLSDGISTTNNRSHAYSGTGTNPAPGQVQYSNADVTLDLGSATNVLFSGAPFTPRIWNGTVYYDVVPAPASLALLGLGGLAAGRRRR